MPTFCRHNRLVQNCPICSREQAVEMRPVVTPGGQAARAARPAGASAQGSGVRSPGARPRSGGLTVRRLSRGADDGYHSPRVPGLRSSADAQRLAEELTFAATRLDRLAADPPGLYAEVADPAGPLEERTWLAFLIVYLGPLDSAEPFAGIEQARTAWSAGEPPRVDDVPLGPRTAHEPARGLRTVDAYRAWAQRAGSQQAAFTGDASWTPDRRFARAFERLALPGLHRGARFDLLATLGRLGVYDVRATALGFGGNDEVTVAAKRVLGIGDSMLLERRAADLAQACGLPLDAIDLGLFNWERGERTGQGFDPELALDEELLASAQAALGL